MVPPAQVCTIAGGSGAGKTTLAMKLLDRLAGAATHLTIDWYYRDLSHLSSHERATVNFDHPDSLEVDLFATQLSRLIAGEAIHSPVYDFATHSRTSATVSVQPQPYIVTEGIHLLGLEAVRQRATLRVFVDISPDVRLARRVQRDVAQRGRTPESVREQWAHTVAPMHDAFVQPSIVYADRVVTIDEDLDDVADELANRLTER